MITLQTKVVGSISGLCLTTNQNRPLSSFAFLVQVLFLRETMIKSGFCDATFSFIDIASMLIRPGLKDIQ